VFKKNKFNLDEYIDYNYVENDEAIISIIIPKVSSFYNEFDADKLAISDDITDFIDSRVKNISSDYDIVLEFLVPKITKKEQEKVKDIIKAHYGLLASSKNHILKVNNYKAIMLLVVGSLFLAISYTLGSFGTLIKEIFYIAGWVAAWETFNTIMVDAITIKSSKLILDRLYNAKIIFTQKKSN
jgi:hypothetical protein